MVETSQSRTAEDQHSASSATEDSRGESRHDDDDGDDDDMIPQTSQQAPQICVCIFVIPRQVS